MVVVLAVVRATVVVVVVAAAAAVVVVVVVVVEVREAPWAETCRTWVSCGTSAAQAPKDGAIQ